MSANEMKMQFTDPSYQALSRMNGKINVMTKTQMIEQLRRFNLNTGGVKNVLKKRLKAHYKRRLIQTPKEPNNGKDPAYDYFVVIDFEATCEENHHSYPHEIIEFPAILVDVSKQVNEFHSYVRPCINKKLTNFCTRLTGITQEVVDSSPTFPEVLEKFEVWLKAHGLDPKRNFAVVTDGPWDMSRFMYLQCRSSGIRLPAWSKRWVNVRKCYSNSYEQPKNSRVSLATMLEGLGMEFEGRCHSGISDSRNIARILVQMISDGCGVFVNERMFLEKMSDVSRAVGGGGGKGGGKKFVPVSRAESALANEDNESEELEGTPSENVDDDGHGDDDDDRQCNEKDDSDKRGLSKSQMKQEKLKRLQEDLESCEDLLYYMSLKKF